MSSEYGVRVRATGAVGVLRFESFQLEIVPKLAGGNVGLFRLIETVSGFGELTLLQGVPELDASGASLLDLVVHALTGATNEVVVRGLKSDYVERQEPLPAVRGRILADRQILDRFGINNRIICRYNQFDQDILENRLLALALDVGVRRAAHPAVKAGAGALASLLQQVCDPVALANEDPAALKRRLVYDRMNEHYRGSHRLALLLLSSLGPTDDLRPGPAQFGSFLIDMNRLFERFVEAAVRRALGSEWQIQSQVPSLAFRRKNDGSAYGMIRPDLIGSPPVRQPLPIDSKYKTYGVGGRKIDTADLAQVLLYALTLKSSGDNAARAALIYPSEREGLPHATTLEARIPTLGPRGRP